MPHSYGSDKKHNTLFEIICIDFTKVGDLYFSCFTRMWSQRMRLLLCVAFSSIAIAQPHSASEFDVASVKIHPPQTIGTANTRTSVSSGNVIFENVTLIDCVKLAYNVPDYAVTGSAPWLRSERYDIMAKAPASSERSQIREMLQTLLIRRFDLKVRHEMRPSNVYVLVPASGGIKLKAIESDTPGRFTSDYGWGYLTAGNSTLSQFADLLTRALSKEIGVPILDQTGAQGRYTFDLKWTPMSAAAKAPDGGESQVPVGATIFTVLSESAGLKLKPQKEPIDTIVIVSANKVPVAN